MEGSKVLHVEICQKAISSLTNTEIKEMVHEEIKKLEDVQLETIMYGYNFSYPVKDHVNSIVYSPRHWKRGHMKVQEAILRFHVYKLTEEDAATEVIENDSENLPVSSHWILPTREFHHLWENLYFDSNIKEDLLCYVETSMLFSRHNVNSNIISCNKVVLLHGPPGTGKTSLCKAIAQKVAIRGMGFTHVEFVEINSHSLFSKWFSESGKLVMKLFSEMKRILENSEVLVCILIDEIESLAHARNSYSNGVEPTDSIRVVNALLTQLDIIKRYPNVLILTTSNLVKAIDLAFIDRADIRQYIGHPSSEAIYKIYASCIKELMRVSLLESKEIFDFPYLEKLGFEENSQTKDSLKLMKLSQESLGLSGRILRKIPFLAYATFLLAKSHTLCLLLETMHLVVIKQNKEKTDDVVKALRNL
ncbi:pachytene checkpoint 2 protein [Colletes latitarsis]|uniref:pachytene checkpoint 2 protein n=1 Tax=Colletes latitarsis TaxID=2605962 RepID=UPI004036386F